MAPVVNSELMDATWRATAVLGPAELKRRQGLCGKEQQELTSFVLAFTSDLEPETLGLALYVHLVVVEAFRSSGLKFKIIKPGKIERTWKDNFGFINDLKSKGLSRQPFQIDPSSASEPFVVQYIVDALTEEEEDPVDLADEDFWHILQVLKTVSDCLHDASRQK